ncbi:MAG TPA: T9SS type A sorting domain-containing protein [Puia sp.]|nr:T9SS type A sorting domain-containing protein [Puia sp.]
MPQLYVIGGASTGGPTASKISSLSLSSGSYISSIDVEKGNKSHLLLTVSNYGLASVWESTDKGTTWTSLDNNGVNLPDIPVRWGMIVPSNANVGTGGGNGGILLATDLGVWSTASSSGTSTVWTQNSSGMGNVSTYQLRLRAADNALVAATHGRGLFSTTLQNILLPVTFVSLNGKTLTTSNDLFWSVANEVNNKGYEVQRKYDDEADFSAIGFVDSKQPNAITNQYSFQDQLVDLGKNTVSYRLKQIDLGGNFDFSPVISLNRSGSPRMVEYIACNAGNLFIRLNNENSSKMIRLQIIDMAGRALMQQNLPCESQAISISSLAGGIYILKLAGERNQQFVQKFIKR